MTKQQIAEFVQQWIDGHEPDTFVKNEDGKIMYSAKHSTLNLPYFFEKLLEDFIESKNETEHAKSEFSSNSFSDGFTDDQKKKMVNSALTTAAQILMCASVLANVENYIDGNCTFPDGSKWNIKFEKKK